VALRLLPGGNQEAWASPGDPDNPRDPRHQAWLRDFDEDAFDRLRRGARANGEFVYNQGSWNAFSDVLSHAAVRKVPDQGTFFHLLPENPNAAEWLIFWLRALTTEERSSLVRTEGGSQALPTALLGELRKFPDRVAVRTRHRLTSLTDGGDGRVRLRFVGGAEVVEDTDRDPILALPQAPLKQLAGGFPEDIRQDLDAVYGFPLLKCLFVVERP
jgi:hypothetical protein